MKSQTEKNNPTRHGSAYDRGGADRYYSRPFSPHYYQAASYQSIKVEADALTPQQLADYSAGWDAERFAKSPNPNWTDGGETEDNERSNGPTIN